MGDSTAVADVAASLALRTFSFLSFSPALHCIRSCTQYEVTNERRSKDGAAATVTARQKRSWKNLSYRKEDRDETDGLTH